VEVSRKGEGASTRRRNKNQTVLNRTQGDLPAPPNTTSLMAPWGGEFHKKKEDLGKPNPGKGRTDEGRADQRQRILLKKFDGAVIN